MHKVLRFSMSEIRRVKKTILTTNALDYENQTVDKGSADGVKVCKSKTI